MEFRRRGGGGRRLVSAVGVSGLLLTSVVGLLVGSPGSASAARQPLCVGTVQAPGVLAGDYRSGVTIRGACTVNHGVAIVHGTLTLAPGSALIAAFALNDATGKGHSELRVFGNIQVEKGAALLLGCDASSFACLDDPNGSTTPTLSSTDFVQGKLIGTQALGIIVHNVKISGKVTETGGGGGTSCAVPTTGVFAEFGSPVYSDLEDSTIHGNVTISGVQSCWMGVIREGVAGNVTVTSNQLADPDAIEILSNTVSGNLVCQHNSMTWDSADETDNLYPRSPEPNTVDGSRVGQCVLSSPATEGGSPGPGPF